MEHPRAAARREVQVDYHKYDGSAHRNYPAVDLGEDTYGRLGRFGPSEVPC